MNSYEPIAVGVLLVDSHGMVAKANADARKMLDLSSTGVLGPSVRLVRLSAR